MPKKLYHFVAIAVTLAINLFYFRNNSLGKTPYGLCGRKVGRLDVNGQTRDIFKDNLMSIIAILFGVGLAIFVLIFTSRNLLNFGSEMNELKRDFLNYYNSYILACIWIWLVIFSSSMAQVFGTD